MKVSQHSAEHVEGTSEEIAQKKIIRENLALWRRDRQRRAVRLSLRDKTSGKFTNVGETAKITNENNDNKVRSAGMHLHKNSKR